MRTLMELLGGLAMLGAAIWIWNRRRPTPREMMDRQMDWARQRELANLQERLEIIRLQRDQTKVVMLQLREKLYGDKAPVSETAEIDTQVVFDSMAREQRAKAALVSVLKNEGVPDESIAAVLKLIDEPENKEEPS